MSARVLLADDHLPIRVDIRETLELSGRFEVCAEAGDGAAAVREAVATRPDLCLLDIRMPGNGLAAAWEITSRLPSARVVMLTVSRNDNDLFAALRAGASGYLLKDVDIDRLLEALDGVLLGEPAISKELVARLVSEFRDRSARRRSVLAPAPVDEPLTSREWQVLDLLRLDRTTGQIAAELVLSQATVRSHVAAILRKLRVPDRASAVRLLQDADAPGR
ncbi:MAG: response regulator [Gaiellales bacterium]|jgi:DNA-binding NarL/FixJ family response regulator|nr:response regulator transcription factor [Gaiellales bacterium]